MKKEIFKKEYLKDLPEDAGVYFFIQKYKNKREILYIGKATNLKDRVSSYFSNDILKTRGVKIRSMIENANSIEFIKTRNVLEAMMLESKLIKEHQPNFNTKEKDNKSYSCVVITKEDFPRVIVKRMREIENITELNFEIDEVFGPFTSKDQLIKSLKIIRKIFPYRDKCEVFDINKKNNKPCFNFQIGLCPGTCCNKISKKSYNKSIRHIKKILNGETDKLIKDLEKEMKLSAKEKDFENAGILRDRIYALEHIKDIALISNENEDINLENENYKTITLESYDVAHISGSYRVGVMCRFEILQDGNDFVLEYKKNEYKKFKLLEKINDDYLGLKELLERRLNHKEWSYSNIMIIDGGKGHLDLAKKVVKEFNESENIKICSVVKDDKHKAREILFDNSVNKVFKDVDKLKYNRFIILANEEAHRFAIAYHKLLRNKIKN